MAVGRPRAFDMNKALDAAMEVFWRKGYEGASMVDLTTAMGISSPSLYAAFGSKKGLFHAVLDHYDQDRAGFLSDVLAQPTARESAARFLFGVADRATDPDEPPGCLLVQSGLSCGDEASDIPKELATHRNATELTLRERFECAKTAGDLPRDANPAALARYLMTVANGICIQASSGVVRKDLRQIAEMALVALPPSVAQPIAEKAVRKKARA
jgi:AcrR family transcriptional regulator